MSDPAYLVALPLLASVVPVLLAFFRERLGWSVAAGTMTAQTALAAWLAADALAAGPVVTDVGGIPAPFGIRLVVDALAAPFVLLVAVTGLVVLGYTRTAGPRSGPFYSLYLLLVAGLTGVCVTADVFNLYVFIEISGLASYGLVARAEGGRAALAAFQYLLLGTVGASLYLLGVGYAYVATGTLAMGELAASLPGATPALVLAAFGLMAVGLAVKMALYPLHTWKPEAYAAAPTGVTALLAALVSTVAAYALLRLLLSTFTVALLSEFPTVRFALLLAAGVSVVAGSVLALRERRVTRFLAYSSVAQFGIVLVGIAVANGTSVTGAAVHLVGHAAMKAGFFVVAGLVATRYRAETVEEYAGLAARSPYLGGAVVVLALGLIGIPPTVGFVGKLYIALGAAEAGVWSGVAIVAVSTLFSLAYFTRLLQRTLGGVDGARRTGGTGARPTVGAVLGVALAVAVTVGLGFVATVYQRVLVPALGGGL